MHTFPSHPIPSHPPPSRPPCTCARSDVFTAAMKTVDVTFQNLDSSEISLTDVSHYFDSDPTKLGEPRWAAGGSAAGCQHSEAGGRHSAAVRRAAARWLALLWRCWGTPPPSAVHRLPCSMAGQQSPGVPSDLPCLLPTRPTPSSCSGWPARRRQDAFRLHRRHHHRQCAGGQLHSLQALHTLPLLPDLSRCTPVA